LRNRPFRLGEVGIEGFALPESAKSASFTTIRLDSIREPIDVSEAIRHE